MGILIYEVQVWNNFLKQMAEYFNHLINLMQLKQLNSFGLITVNILRVLLALDQYVIYNLKHMTLE